MKSARAGRERAPTLAVVALFTLACTAHPAAPDAARVDASRRDSARPVDAPIDAPEPDTRFDAGECGLFDPDHDFIDSADEGRADPDDDGVSSDHDDDSDGDGVLDVDEAGDALCRTLPVRCARETPADRWFDALDADSDGDGLGDGDELIAGTMRCEPDSDGDGIGDLLEHAYSHWSCIVGGREACGCASMASCSPSSDDVTIGFLDPSGTPSVERIPLRVPEAATHPLDVGTRIEVLPLDGLGIDPRLVVSSVGPACVGASTDCWTEPAGVAHADAVAEVGATGFVGVAPGTAVDFSVAIIDELFEPGARALILGVRVDLVEVGTAEELDHRDLVLLLPAR